MLTPGDGQVTLAWIVTTGHWSPALEFTSEVYRDGALIELDRFVDDEVSNGESYEYQVVVIVEGGEAARSQRRHVPAYGCNVYLNHSSQPRDRVRLSLEARVQDGPLHRYDLKGRKPLLRQRGERGDQAAAPMGPRSPSASSRRSSAIRICPPETCCMI